MSELEPSFRTLNFAIAYLSSAERRSRIETLKAELLLSPENPDELRQELGCLRYWEYDFSGAVSQWEHALILAKGKWGAEHPTTACRMAQLADGYHTMGQWTRAAQFAEFAASQAENLFEEDHPDHAAILGILARIYLSQCRYADAEDLLLRALAAQEQYWGPSHQETALSFHLLGELFTERGEYAEAREVYERALHAFNESLGLYHPYRLHLLTHLASVLEQQGEKTLAQGHLDFLLAHYQEHSGEQHLDTLYSKARRFFLEPDNTDWPHIEQILQTTLEKEQQVFGDWHPRTAMTRNNIGFVAARQERQDMAEACLRQALTVQKNAQESHSQIIGILRNLAWLLVAQERYAEAEPLLRQAVDVTESLFGSYHAFLCPALSDLASLYCSINRPDAAKPVSQWALLISEKTYGEGHHKTVPYLSALGSACFHRQEWAEAERLGKRALEIHEGHYGKDHPDSALLIFNLGMLYLLRKNYPLAESYFDWSLAINEVAGTENPARYDSLYYMGLSLAGQDRFEEAEPLVRLAVSLAEEKMGAGHATTVTMWEFLAECLEKKGRHAESAEISRRLRQTAPPAR